MCCFFSTLFFFGPRLAFLIYWLIPAGRIKIAVTFNSWIWPLLGIIFVPWTTLMYTIVYGANGIVGFDWLWLGLGLLADISSYAAGAARRKDASFYTGP